MSRTGTLFVCISLPRVSLKNFVKYLALPKKVMVFTCLLYKSFEITAGKGEIARNEQFLHFPQCFLPVSKPVCHFDQI